MTHLSDMSYLHRAVNTTWFYLWFLFYVSRWDRFEAFRLRRLLRFELRSVVTVLILVSLGLQLAYDIGSARLKYLEGFWTNPKTHEIQARPAQSWTEEDILHVEPLYYTLACSLSLQNCAFFLLQAFWSYISKSVTKSTFMSSFEFKVHLIASCGVVVLFPTVQYLFRNDFVYREVVPHLIFCILLFTTGVLGLRIHFRLVALVKNASITMNESTLSVLEKLEYFKDMNVILTFSLFACSFSLGIVAVDGITPHPTIAGNKFASDLLITNLNFFQVIIWVTLTLIFYPRKSVITASLGSYDNSTSNNNNNNINNNNNNGGRHDITISNKRGHSDRIRLSRRNNEVQSEENLQNDSKAQLVVAAGAEDREILDPYWARDDSRQEQEYQQEYQHQQQQRRQHGHLRAFSHDSRNDTAITLTPLSPPPPSLTVVTSSAGQPDITKEVTSLTSPPPRGSPTSPTGRPEMETRTLYYHEALAKAQQQQQQEQSNEYYNMTSVATDSDYNTGSLPQRTFSQGSHYKPNSSNSNTSNSNNNNRNSGGASRPERSSERPAPSSHQAAALGRSTPTVDMHHHPHRAVSPIGRNTSTTRGGAVSPPPGGRSASSMDSRPPRDYPSITQAAAAAHAQDQDSPQELQRMRSAGSNYRSSNNANRPLNPATAHQEMGMRMMADPRIVDPRTVSALGHHHTPPAHPHPYQHRRQDSEESDLSVIQIAYVGNMNHASAAAAPEQGHRQGQHDEEFYNGLSSSALRPYSPR